MPDELDMNDPEIQAYASAIASAPSVGSVVAEAKLSDVNPNGNFDRDSIEQPSPDYQNNLDLSGPTLS